MQTSNSNICDCPEKIRAACKCSKCSGKTFKCFHRYSMIMASAGTGKTHSLAMRYLQLLAFGVDPAEILAVTFTKKAAGEIFDKIIKRLIEMISEQECTCAAVSSQKLVTILKKLLSTSSDLKISTIDSFFGSLLRAYAPELGMPSEISIIEGNDDRPIRAVLRKWLRSANTEEREELRELLKSAKEGKQINFEQSMKAIITDLYSVYLKNLHDNGKGKCAWGMMFDFEKNLPDADVQECKLLGDKLNAYAINALSGVAQTRVKALASYIADEKRGKFPQDVKNLLKDNFNKQNKAFWIFENCAPLAYTKKIEIPEKEADLIRKIFKIILKSEIEQCRKKTKAVHSLIEKYDSIYTKEIRNRGILTFDDPPLMLRNSEESGVFHLSSSEDMNMEERLDAAINHYLFDEFQDTSHNQWYIFENLVDEILSSCDDRFRSLFCVGDIKQSIYSWRDGDPYLFGKVIQKSIPAAENLGYNPLESLFKSYRSSKDILDTVNRIFDREKTPAVYQKCIDTMNFERHESNDPALTGFSALISTENVKADNLLDIQARIIVDTLHKIAPFSRSKKLSVGVLFQQNKTCEELSSKIKELCNDLPVSIDGYIRPQNSMAFVVLKQLIVLSEHPDDPIAKGVLKMLSCAGTNLITPADIAEKMNYTKYKSGNEQSEFSYDDLAEFIKNDIFRNNLDGFIQKFLDAFGDNFSEFDYDRIEAARSLAESFNGTPEEYLHALDIWHMQKDQSVSSTIQFMTIHKAKGLEFDIVFLPDMDSKLYQAYNKLELAHPKEVKNNIRWVNYFPNTDILKLVPELVNHRQLMDEDRLLDECCKFYVATTRAKRAMYIFSDSKNKDVLPVDATDLHFKDVMCGKLAAHGMKTDAPELQNTLNNLNDISQVDIVYATGDESWYLRNFSSSELETDSVPAKKGKVVFHSSARRRKLASQQQSEFFEPMPENRFNPRAWANTGTVLHGLFELIDYVNDNFNAEEFIKDKNISEEIAELFVNSMTLDSEIRKHLAKPDTPHILWKERRFLLKDDDGSLIPGAFDRVTVFLDDNGNMQSAEILDYKSDDVKSSSELVKRHRLQLLLYRKCLCRMTGIPEEKIKLYLAAVRTGKIVEVTNN